MATNSVADFENSQKWRRMLCNSIFCKWLKNITGVDPDRRRSWGAGQKSAIGP
jgi:hypothetical protein